MKNINNYISLHSSFISTYIILEYLVVFKPHSTLYYIYKFLKKIVWYYFLYCYRNAVIEVHEKNVSFVFFFAIIKIFYIFKFEIISIWKILDIWRKPSKITILYKKNYFFFFFLLNRPSKRFWKKKLPITINYGY